ncbi:MAG: hypothetical protein C0424_12505 [Sphingobacteriaceae bacterium]|nr:hypothetical protein [Sphingobacteriaceae bacterium]
MKFALAIVLFMACKKEQIVVVPDPQPLPRMLVSSMRDLPGSKVVEFTYDAANRLVRWEGYDFQLSSDLFHHGTYHYENNALRRMDYVNEFFTDIDQQTTFYANVGGRIDSISSWGIFARSSGKKTFDAQSRVLSYLDYGLRNQLWLYDYGNTANCVSLRRDSAVFNFSYDQNRRPDWGLPAIYQAHAGFLYFAALVENSMAMLASTNNLLQNGTTNHSWQYSYNANQYPDTIRVFQSGSLHSVWILEYVPAN